MANEPTNEPVNKRTRTTVSAVREDVETMIGQAKNKLDEHRLAIKELQGSIDAYQRVLAVMEKSGE
jgi:hypothetical protein